MYAVSYTHLDVYKRQLYSKEQIEEQVQFQEKYFEYEIECAEE